MSTPQSAVSETPLAPTIQGDGSLSDAVMSMPDQDDDDGLEPPSLQQTKPVEKPVEAKPAAASVKAAEVEAAVADDEDEIEIPAEEEGKEPTRVKLSAALEAYRNLPKVAEELARAKSSGPSLPHEIEQELVALGTARQRHLEELQNLKRIYEPRAPDFNLTNPQHPNYNPEAFHAQLQNYNQAIDAQAQIKAREDRLIADQNHQQQALAASQFARERAGVERVWPEFLAKPDVAKEAFKTLREHYKFDDATLNSVVDHRFYALTRDALAYRALQGKQAEAAKVAKAKPRLIQSAARSKPDTQAGTRSAAFERLAQSGSLEDAAASIEL